MKEDSLPQFMLVEIHSPQLGGPIGLASDKVADVKDRTSTAERSHSEPESREDDLPKLKLL